VTRLLEDAAAGHTGATDALLPVVYDELRRLAGALMSHEKPGQTLQPTALVHEAYLKLIGSADLSWQNRAHFFGAAARAMRQILIDRARRVKVARAAREAIGNEFLVEGGSFGSANDADDLLALDLAMEELRTRDERQHEIVMLRYFAGLTIEQTASAMDLSTGTIKNEWAWARAWLLRRIELARGERDRLGRLE
jgi:RNA polymerase sigma factor (TIGR02999 family)